MSCYGWEHGEIRLPTAEFSKVRQKVQDAATTVKTEAFEKTQSFWKGLSRKEQTDPDAYRAAMYRWERDTSPGPARDMALGLIGYHHYPAAALKPARVKKSDVDFPTNRTTQFYSDDLFVTFDRQSSIMVWDVAENNRSVDRANQSWLAEATKGALGEVRWTGKNTGGVLVGNDEYNREADYAGGGGNYVTEGFGPLGAIEAPNHTEPYTDSKGRRMHGVAKVGRYGLVGKIEPYEEPARRFGYGGFHSPALAGNTGVQGRQPRGVPTGGQFAAGRTGESGARLN